MVKRCRLGLWSGTSVLFQASYLGLGSLELGLGTAAVSYNDLVCLLLGMLQIYGVGLGLTAFSFSRTWGPSGWGPESKSPTIWGLC